MDMSGEQRIPAPREEVWRALNDPEILKLCIPGCQELVKSSDTQMSAKVVLKVGPVSARFEGAVTLSDLDPPNSYRISGEGQGGMAGFAKGEAMVRLEADGDGTILRYEVEAQVGGKLAQLGARLIDATAKQMSGAFFKRFAEEVFLGHGGPHAPQTTATGNAQPTPGAEPDATRRPSLRQPAPAQPPQVSGGVRLAGLSVVALALTACVYLLTSVAPTGMQGVRDAISVDFAVMIILILTAAVGYLFGRLGPANAPVVALDRDTIEVLATRTRREP